MRRYSLIVSICLLSTLAFGATPPKNKISMEKARGAALKKCVGDIKSSELEQEKGLWIYSFDILGKDNRIHEIQINARNGKVVSEKIETPSHEAEEKKADEKAMPAGDQKNK